VEVSRIQIILIMGLTAFAIRSLPHLIFVGGKFPEALDRWLRYVSYALICSIISITLFMSGARFEVHAAPRRALALAVVVFISHRTKSPVIGMIVGVILLLVLSWMH
jgi:branched-subunit amino acid transport protein